MPSDDRGEAQDLAKDFAGEEGAKTYANAFWPLDPREPQRFWGDCMRSIFAAVFMTIAEQLGTVGLRQVLAVLQSPEDTLRLLRRDIYHEMALRLVENGDEDAEVTEVADNIRKSIDARVAEMRTVASHLDHAARERPPFSLDEFLESRGPGILVISKHSTYESVQDPMNSMLFMRIQQLLDAKQKHPRRKIFIIIDEFPTLAGDRPCEKIVNAFLRLRNRGAVILIAYQLKESIERVYGDKTARELLEVCQNRIENLEPATPRRGIAARPRSPWPRRGGGSSDARRSGSFATRSGS